MGISKVFEPNGHVYYLRENSPVVIFAPPLKGMDEGERDGSAGRIFDLLDRIPRADQDSVNSVVVDSEGLRGGTLSEMDALWRKQAQVFVNLPDLRAGDEKVLSRIARGVDKRYESSQRFFNNRREFVQSYLEYYTGQTDGWPEWKKEIFNSGRYSSGDPVQGGWFYRVRALSNRAAHALFTDPLADLATWAPWLWPAVNRVVQTIGNVIIRD